MLGAYIDSIKISRWSVLGTVVRSHLLYADDCLIFTKADLSDVDAVRDVTDQYYTLSGQVVNLEKSIISFGNEVHN